MNDNKHIIWSDINLNLEDWREALEENNPGVSEDRLYELMVDYNAMNIDDERANLDIQLPREIIVIADLGRWDGRKSGYKMINSGNIKDCLYSDCDYNEWYVDKNGEFRCTTHHHDGTNHYLYRAVKENATDEQVSLLQNRIYNERGCIPQLAVNKHPIQIKDVKRRY